MKNKIKNAYAISMVLITALQVMSIFAADVTWNGTANDGLWSNVNNWEGGVLPATADTALLRSNGFTNYIHLGANRTLEALGLYNQTFCVSGDGLYGLVLTGTNSIKSVNESSGAAVVFDCDLELDQDTVWTLPYGTVKLGKTVSGDADIVVSGGNNRTLAIAGDLETTGTVEANISEVIVGSSYTDFIGATKTGGTLQNVGSVTMVGAENYYSWVPTFKIDNTDESVDNRLPSGFSLIDGGFGMNLAAIGNGTSNTTETLDTLDLGLGLHTLTVNGTAGATMALHVNNIIHRPGAFAWGSFGTNGKLFPKDAVNVDGMWEPWCLVGSSFSTVNGDGSIGSSPTYYTLGATGNESTKIYKVQSQTVALEEPATISALKIYGWGNVNLGDYDLAIKHGAVIFDAYNDKNISSTGGRVVFGGDDIILYVGSGPVNISAPVVWNRPAGNTTIGPSIHLLRMWSSMTFSGDDMVGDYDALKLDDTNRAITFGGAGDRTFHGPVIGKAYFTKNGSGTLRFDGPRYNPDGNYGISASDGRLVLGNSASFYNVTTTNCTLAVGNGASIMAKFYARDTTSFGGIGTLNQALTDRGWTVSSGSSVAPGDGDEIGTLTLATAGYKTVTFSNGSTVKVKIDGTTSDRIRVAAYSAWGYTAMPAAGGVVNLDVSALANTTTAANTQYTIMKFDNYDPSNATAFTWNITTSTPLTLDVSNATVTYTDKSYVLSGVKNTPNGTLIFIR